MRTDIDWENDKSLIAEPHILVVDDEPLILRNLEVVLVRKGCRVSVAATGSEGLNKAHANPPDAILLDVVMPDIDGYDVCRRLKSDPALRHIPVLLITALNDVFSKVKGLDAGADDFISKPFNESELRARLWAHLRNKRLHDQLQTSYKRLQDLEQMKEALTHMVMHDVSAPLTAVHFGLEAVVDALDEGQKISAVHERMLRSSMLGCRRVVDMLRDVLVVQRLEENKFPLHASAVDIPTLTSGCLALLEASRAAVGVKINSSIEPNLPQIIGDETLLMRVLTNLVGNALKFTSRNGNVWVTFRRAAESQIEGAVIDDGVGIPSEYLTRIFEKYVQAEATAVRSGMGLGLTFCQLAIQAHGGKIWAENNPDHGSRFIFRIPIASSALLNQPLVSVTAPASV